MGYGKGNGLPLSQRSEIIKELFLLYCGGMMWDDLSAYLKSQHNLDYKPEYIRVYIAKGWWKAKMKILAKAETKLFREVAATMEKAVKAQAIKVKDIVWKVINAKLIDIQNHPEKYVDIKTKELLDYLKFAETLAGGVTERTEQIKELRISVAEVLLRRKEEEKKKINVETSENRIKDVLDKDEFKF